MDKTCINCRKYLMLESRCGHETWPCESNRVCDIGKFEACEEEEKKEIITAYDPRTLFFPLTSGSPVTEIEVEKEAEKLVLPSAKDHRGHIIRIEITEKRDTNIIVEDKTEKWKIFSWARRVNLMSDGEFWYVINCDTWLGNDSEEDNG